MSAMSDWDEVLSAIWMIALQIIAHAAENAIEDAWEDWPEVGVFDWDVVASAVADLAPHPEPSAVKAAYEFLAKRADHS